MAKVIATLRALGILTLLWGVLLGVGWAAGALPMDKATGDSAGAASRPEARAEETTATEGSSAPPAETTTSEVGAAPSAPSMDTGSAATEPPAEAPASNGVVSLTRYDACSGDTRAPRLRAIALFGGASQQLLLACDAEAAVLALPRSPEGQPPTPYRVARVRAHAEQPNATARITDAAAADVSGDGRPDLLLSFTETDARGGAQGGALFLVSGNALGALDEPLRLASFAAVSVAAAELDGAGGAEVVAMNRADSFGRRASEAWLFTGGAAPARKARLRAGRRGLQAVLIDLDRDTHLDVVALSEDAPALHVHFGDGSGGFPRARTLELDGARELVVGDLDGDGAEDLLVVGTTVAVVRASAADALTPEPVRAPDDLQSAQARDLDGDGLLDLIAISGDGVVWMRQVSRLAFELKPLFDLPLTVGSPRALAVAELDGQPGLDAAVLVRVAGEDTPWQLVLVPNALSVSAPAVDDAGHALPDAPLVLDVVLR